VIVDATQLTVVKTDGYNSIVAGQPTTYTITVTNNGTETVTNVVVTDPFTTASPNGFVPGSISWTCNASGGAGCTNPNGVGDINETIASMPAGSQVIFTVTATLNPDADGATPIANTAQINPPGGPTSTDTNGVIFDPPTGVKSGVTIDATHIRWTMTWFNTGAPQTVTITDTLEANQTFAGNLTCQTFGTSTQTDCSQNGNVITWSGTIGTGNENRIEIAFDVQVPGDGNYTNTAVLTSSGTNLNVTASNSVTVTNGTGESIPPTGTPAPTVTPQPGVTPTPDVIPGAGNGPGLMEFVGMLLLAALAFALPIVGWVVYGRMRGKKAG
jgi:uncharacterized repeat protein (TIGR01451 family)